MDQQQRVRGDRESPEPDQVVASRQFACPFCDSSGVNRMFLASLRLDSCECATCGAHWDEERGSGEYRGRAQRSSVVIRSAR